MPNCACNKAKKIIKPNTNTNNSDYNVNDDEPIEVSSFHSRALANVNSTPTFKTQRYGKGEGAIQFMKQVPVLILQGMKVKVIAKDTSTPTKKKISLNWVDDLVGGVEDQRDTPVSQEADDCVMLGEVKFVIFDGSTD